MGDRILAQSLSNGLFVLDLATGAHVGHFKKGSAKTSGVCFLSSSRCTAGLSSCTDVLVVMDATQPFIHFVNVNYLQGTCQSYSVPENLSAIGLTPCGSFCVGAGVSGLLFVWCTATGQLIKQWRHHFRSILCLAISSNGSYLFTACEDSTVCCYTMNQVLSCTDECGNVQFVEPVRLHRWTAHSLPVVTMSLCDISYNDTLAISGSLDRTVHVWTVSSEHPLISYSFPSRVHHIETNPVTLEAYVCATDNKIYVIDLGSVVAQWRNGEVHAVLCPTTTPDTFFLGHEHHVTCCACNADGSTLVSCGDDGIRIWDVLSRQVVNHFPAFRDTICGVRVFMGGNQNTLLTRKTEKQFGAPCDLQSMCLAPLQPFMRNPIAKDPDIVFVSSHREQQLRQEIHSALDAPRDLKKGSIEDKSLQLLLSAVVDATRELTYYDQQRNVTQLQEEKQEIRKTVKDFFTTLCTLESAESSSEPRCSVKTEPEHPFSWLQKCVVEQSLKTSAQAQSNSELESSNYPYVDRTFALSYLKKPCDTASMRQETMLSIVSSDSAGHSIDNEDRSEETDEREPSDSSFSTDASSCSEVTDASLIELQESTSIDRLDQELCHPSSKGHLDQSMTRNRQQPVQLDQSGESSFSAFNRRRHRIYRHKYDPQGLVSRRLRIMRRLTRGL